MVLDIYGSNISNIYRNTIVQIKMITIVKLDQGYSIEVTSHPVLNKFDLWF